MQVQQAQLSDMTAAAHKPKGFIQASQSENVGLRKPLNETFWVEKSKSIQNSNKESWF